MQYSFSTLVEIRRKKYSKQRNQTLKSATGRTHYSKLDCSGIRLGASAVRDLPIVSLDSNFNEPKLFNSNCLRLTHFLTES